MGVSSPIPGGAGPAPGFPRMHSPSERVDALAWYSTHGAAFGLNKMQFDARDEVVPLVYQHPENPDLIGVPRTLAPEPAPGADFRSLGNHEFDAKFTGSLRPKQRPFVGGCFRMLEHDFGGIGEAETGFGKTVCGAALITLIGRTTCIIIPKGDLDWKPEILEHTDIPEDRIDVWKGQRLPDPKAWVVIASLQSIYRSGVYPDEVYRRFGCVIFDECHRLGAPEFNAAARKFPAMLRLGLSATADRRDGKMDLIHSHLGWRHIKGQADAVQPQYFILPTEWEEPFIGGKRCRFDPMKTNSAEKSLIADPMRNAKIAGAAWRAHAAGRRTIIFVKQLKHGDRLEEAMRSMGVPANRVVQYNSKTGAEGKALVKQCPPGLVVIATYKYTAEGTNVPALDTAIIAHPTYDPRQAVGRILRQLDGKLKPVVLDVWDQKCGVLMSLAKARWNYLQQQGASWKGVFS